MKSLQPTLLASDLEGVFIPEIWIAVAEMTGIERLRLTTRDISDYDELMQMRLQLLRQNNLTLWDIQSVIANMDPLPGALDFLNWVRGQTRLIILTDSFDQFVAPFLPKLNYPTVFAHQLEMSPSGEIVDYHLRAKDSKRQAILSFAKMGFRTIAVGDSYNDTSMLLAADTGILFHPPENVIADFPQLPVSTGYDDLRHHIEIFLGVPILEPA